MDAAACKVLHRINLNVVGGVEHQFCQFLQHRLAAAGMTHEVMVGDPAHPDLWPMLQPHLAAVHSFKSCGGWRLPRRPAILRHRNMARIVSRSAPDVVLSWSSFARPELGRACARAQVPLVHREGGGAWFERSAAAASEFVSQLSGAVCNSRASMRMLQLKWGYAGPARVCLAGVRPDMQAAADAGQKVPANGELRLGTAARLVAEKGVCLAIQTLRLLRDRGLPCRLAIAGDGPDRNALAHLAERLGVGSKVRFLGSVGDMAGFYRSLDILLHPALQEPLGNVTIEAGAFGVPVVATRVDGLAETIQNGITGVTVPALEPLATYADFGGGTSSMLSQVVYDPDADALRAVRFPHPEALAQAVAALAADETRRAALSAAAATYVRDTFSFDRYCAEFIRWVRLFAATRPLNMGD